MTSLKIIYTNTVMDSCLLRDVFNHLSGSSLLHLELRVLPFDGDAGPNPVSRPLYLPSVLNAKEFLAIKYDLLWRPLRHPLERMESIISLTFIGHPSVEMEEVIFKLSTWMEARANQEGKRTEKVEKKDFGRPGCLEWFYKIEIADKDTKSAGQP